jgi:hypothetical protein
MSDLTDAEALKVGQYVPCATCDRWVGPSDLNRLTAEGTVLCAACAYPGLTPEELERATFSYPEPRDADDERARALLVEALGEGWRWAGQFDTGSRDQEPPNVP